jgi:hypothetical protein
LGSASNAGGQAGHGSAGRDQESVSDPLVAEINGQEDLPAPDDEGRKSLCSPMVDGSG